MASSERARFPDISSSAWEHPADRAALNALRRIPGFDIVLRKLVGMFGEKSIRLTFKANAVRVSDKQYPWIHERLLEVCSTFDLDEPPELYVSQSPLVNAGAVGLNSPFIVLNSSTIEILDRDQVEAVIAHEIGHIMSGHAVYRTMLFILLRFALTRYPLAGVAVRPILYGLLEWNRKAELSCDRAGVLAVQDPEIMMGALMRIAGGSRGEALNLDEFIAQSDEYRGDSDVLGGVYKLMAALGATHPFAVVRVAELREWVDGGDYQRILDGDYRTNTDDTEMPYTDDLGDAAGGYAATVRKLADDVSDKIGHVTTRIADGWRTQSGTNDIDVKDDSD
ncbi:MAG: M48 family metallopeptidase [Acidimicrobiaceae bacterium]|jgi:Zn-dependent protease with chaperone function|nr:M48 family metallopeptidase [Acidimicrobiaceae bacterium]MBT5851601.1 M48 family metallopeptidase [Acidimicrobiaceae bacterium]